MTIGGPISAKDTDWVVFLVLIDEDGNLKGENLNYPGLGIVRARFRNSTRTPELLEKDKIYEYDIDLGHYARTIPKGWRIRMEITSAFFPSFSRNLNTGGHNEMETDCVIAKQRVFHTGEYPSPILLPVVDSDDLE